MGKFLRKAFVTGKGVKKVDPTSPNIFNIVGVAVARVVLVMVYGPQEAQHRLRCVSGEINLVFYANNGRIAG